MSSSDEGENDASHQLLLRNVNRSLKRRTSGGIRLPPSIEQTGDVRVEVDDLIDAIHSTRNVNGLKKQLKTERGKAEGSALVAPVHRQQRERIQRAVGYTETSKEVSKWQTLVTSNRLAEQLIFPLNETDRRRGEPTMAEKVVNFKPRTPLELEMEKVLKNSKCNLSNTVEYTEEELELIRAMNIKEARAKCAQLQKMRALMSYKEAKYRREKKIKSKQYHRIQKRQKRRKLMKEFDDLMTRDPEAAKEKLEQLEKDRIMERATQKHRGGTKWSKEMTLHASRDPTTRARIADHLRFGRELKHKTKLDSSDDEEEAKTEDQSIISIEQLQQSISSETTSRGEEEMFNANPWLKSSLKRLKQDRKIESEGSALNEAMIASNEALTGRRTNEALTGRRTNGALTGRRMNEALTGRRTNEALTGRRTNEALTGRRTNEALTGRRMNEALTGRRTNEALTGRRTNEALTGRRMNREGKTTIREEDDKRKITSNEALSGRRMNREGKTTIKEPSRIINVIIDSENEEEEEPIEDISSSEKGKVNAETIDVDVLFDSVEKRLIDSTRLDVHMEKKGKKKKKKSTVNVQSSEKNRKKGSIAEEKEIQTTDINIDPKHFLKVQTGQLMQVSPDFLDQMDEFTDGADENNALMAEAFADDDVIGDFEQEKTAIEEAGRPKDIDLHLEGWGNWTGPGISVDARKKKRFTVPAPAQKRKDRGLAGVIIREAEDRSIQKHQLAHVPFPFSNADDVEAVIRQPIGREWSSHLAHRDLTKPAVITKAGRVIRPMNKEALKGMAMEDGDFSLER